MMVLQWLNLQNMQFEKKWTVKKDDSSSLCYDE